MTRLCWNWIDHPEVRLILFYIGFVLIRYWEWQIPHFQTPNRLPFGNAHLPVHICMFRKHMYESNKCACTYAYWVQECVWIQPLCLCMYVPDVIAVWFGFHQDAVRHFSLLKVIITSSNIPLHPRAPHESAVSIETLLLTQVCIPPSVSWQPSLSNPIFLTLTFPVLCRCSEGWGSWELVEVGSEKQKGRKKKSLCMWHLWQGERERENVLR